MEKEKVYVITYDALFEYQVAVESKKQQQPVLFLRDLPKSVNPYDLILIPAELFLENFPFQGAERSIVYGNPMFIKQCFTLGAADYISTPVNYQELFCRIQKSKLINNYTPFFAGNIQSHVFNFKTCSIHLSNEEEIIFRTLISFYGKTVSRKLLQIALIKNKNKLSPLDFDIIKSIKSRNIDMRISKLRKKLDVLKKFEYYPEIISEYGEGYFLTLIFRH